MKREDMDLGGPKIKDSTGSVTFKLCCELQVMELLLAFMYQGEVTVASHHIIPLMEAARLLGVQGLTDPFTNRPLHATQKER